MLFKNLFKKKKELSCEEFGKDYLGQWLLTSAKSCPDLFDELGVEMTHLRYFYYLAYHLFLSKKILSQRYSDIQVGRIIFGASCGIIDYMDTRIVSADKKDDAKSLFWSMYDDTKVHGEEICNDIGSKDGLKNLSKSFLEDCGLQNGFLENLAVFTLFSGFIIHHTSDILTDKIELF